MKDRNAPMLLYHNKIGLTCGEPIISNINDRNHTTSDVVFASARYSVSVDDLVAIVRPG